MKIVPKLYCNLSPQTQEEASLILARNMKLDTDGNLVSDYGYESIDIGGDSYTIVGHIVGLDNLIYLFIKHVDNGTTTYGVYEYNEENDDIEELDIPWTYHNGKITGCVNTNQSGEKILTVSEYDCYNGVQVPLKHYNLSYANDHAEMLSVQAPEVPIANLILETTYAETIPSGVYVFFIRYRIRKDVYTDWFLCSRPVFAGTSEKLNTIQGGVKYINTHKDSAKSFKFRLNFVYVDTPINDVHAYEGYQIGFIITHDEATDARIWKDFDLPSNYSVSTYDNPTDVIYFDYKDVKETNIDDLLKSTYELYDVKNVTTFKNKLYISNYKETNFEPNINVASATSSFNLLPEEYELPDNTIDAKLTLLDTTYSLVKSSNSVDYYDRATFRGTDDTISSLLANIDMNTILDTNIIGLYKITVRNEVEIGKITAFSNSTYNPDIYLVHKFKKNPYVSTRVVNNVPIQTVFDNILPDELDKSTNASAYADEPANPTADISLDSNYKKLLYYGGGIYLKNVAQYDASGTIDVLTVLDVDKHPFYTNGNKSYSKSDIPFAFGSIPAKYGGISVVRSKTAGNTLLAYNLGFTENDNILINNEFKTRIKNKSCYVIVGIDAVAGADIIPVSYAYNNLNNSMCTAEEVTRYSTPINNDNYLSGIVLDINVDNDITNNADYIESEIKLYQVYAAIVGIGDGGEIVLNVNGTIVKTNTFIYRIKKYEFDCSIENRDVNSSEQQKDITITLKTTDYECLVTKFFKSSVLNITDITEDVEQRSVLAPKTNYDAYIHFVDKYGIVTKGYKIPSELSTNWFIDDYNNSYFTLTYIISNDLTSLIQAGYKALFVSLVRKGDIILQGFNYKHYDDNTNILYCLELDTLLYNLNDNITVTYVSNDEATDITAKYCSSGENNSLSAFGNCGFLYWKGEDLTGNKFYIKIPSEATKSKTLTKSTEYIPLTSSGGYKEFKDGYYGSWLSKVKKPDYEYCYNIYVSGSDVYNIKRKGVITLEEFKTYYTVFNSPLYYITSPFNLNYLSLTEDINDKLYRIENTNIRQVAKSIPSQRLSYIYELKSMYKDYMNKYFRKIEGNVKTIFDNTIRVSNVLSDETFNNSIFVFEPENYYNIPTNRGIIVKLFAIGNNIYAHAERSLFKFNGNQTIQASEADINLQESEPFDTGITEILDSEYGYGGIVNKEAGCVTFDSYFFYDAASKHMFAYSGNNQLQIIDAPIKKLLDSIKPTMCLVLHDSNNNRVFFELYTNRNNVTIQYNYKSKSFISFTDVTLDKSFSTIKNCYSYTNWNHGGNYANYITYMNTVHIGEPGFPIVKPKFGRLFTGELDATSYNKIAAIEPDYDETEHEYDNYMPANLKNLFGAATYLRSLKAEGYDYIKEASPYSICVICFPKSYYNEVINSIKIDSTFNTNNIEENNDNTIIKLIDYNVIKDNYDESPIKNIYVQTNSCKSNLVKNRVNIEDKTANVDYKIIKFDKGFWNVNYLRDMLAKERGIDNRYSYNPQEYINRANADMVSDKASLVYGKYFIVGIYFVDYKAIKIENIFINTSNYD